MSNMPRVVRQVAMAWMLAIGSAAFGAQAIPVTMRAVTMDRPGGPEVLEVRTLPVPKVDAHDVLIAVHAASVASWDIEIRQSLAYVKPKFPYTLGSDGSGVIAAVGSAVDRFAVGDEVYAYCWDNPKGGFYAEFVAVAADCVSKLPRGVSLEAAGALGASGLTALSGVDRVLGVKRGESLIIHGASGAVGTLALQIAKVRGARVLATASGEEGVALVRRLGADAVVDGRTGDIAAAAREFAPQGVDAVLALAGGAALEKCLGALRAGGRVAYPNGVNPAPAARPGITVTAYDALSGAQQDQFAQLNRAVEARHFEVPIAATFALADAAAAHRRVEAGRVPGKVLLRIR
jgi:NADPH:quinone reductase-like Zn-dependent oxidoreductase